MNSMPFSAAWLAVVLAMTTCGAAPLSATPDVVARITSPAGSAIAGATAFVFTAAPKVGTSALCPSCYPDCGKAAQSDADGRFVFSGLSSELVFRLLVVAKGFAPKFIPGVEPGEPQIEVTLEVRRDADVPNVQTARGRVSDSAGTPIRGAVIEIDGIALDGGRHQYGGLRDTDALAVTDENGEFVLTSGMPALALSGRISARSFANQSVYLVTGKSQALTLTEGATLVGHIMLAGRPVPRITIGVSPQDRSSGSFVGNFEVGTDDDGRFLLPNLPPKTDYNVYGKMETVGAHGSIPTRPVHLGRDREVTDIGELTVQAALRLSGRVVLEDGTKLPEKSRLLVGRDQVSDLLSVDLDAEGGFNVHGIPPGIVTLGVRVPGYKVSAKNRSFEIGNRRLAGRVEADITGLEMLLDKRDPNEGTISSASWPRPKAGERPQDRPLHGVEAGP